MFLSVGASTEAKPLHVCSVGPVSTPTRHAVVCVFLAFMKITISPLTRGEKNRTFAGSVYREGGPPASKDYTIALVEVSETNRGVVLMSLSLPFETHTTPY